MPTASVRVLAETDGTLKTDYFDESLIKSIFIKMRQKSGKPSRNSAVAQD